MSTRFALVAGLALALVSHAVHAAGPVPQFGPATPVAALNSAGQDVVDWVSPDGLRIVINSNRAGGGMKLYSASRPDLSSPFSTPVATEFAEPNATSSDTRDGVLSANGLELFYSDESLGTTTIYRATRANTSSPFSNRQALPALSVTSALTFPAWLSPDSLHLYEYDNATHVYVASRPTPTSPFGTPTAVPLANLGANDRFTLTPDELQIYYRIWNGDIYWSSRASIADPFPAGALVPSLSGIGAAVPVLSGNTMYMLIGQDIYRATLLPEPAMLAPLAFFVTTTLRRRHRRPI